MDGETEVRRGQVTYQGAHTSHTGRGEGRLTKALGQAPHTSPSTRSALCGESPPPPPALSGPKPAAPQPSPHWPRWHPVPQQARRKGLGEGRRLRVGDATLPRPPAPAASAHSPSPIDWRGCVALGKRLGFSVSPFLSHQMEVLSTSRSTDNTDRNPRPGACHPEGSG